MVQLQLDARNLFGKIAPDIVDAHMKSGDAATFALCLDHHTYLPINAGCGKSRERGQGKPDAGEGNPQYGFLV
jgi:hypothetical protein